MVTPLLDVNVLIALAWPTHVHHETAVDWFTSRSGQPWATTAIAVESGAARTAATTHTLAMTRHIFIRRVRPFRQTFHTFDCV